MEPLSLFVAAALTGMVTVVGKLVEKAVIDGLLEPATEQIKSTFINPYEDKKKRKDLEDELREAVKETLEAHPPPEGADAWLRIITSGLEGRSKDVREKRARIAEALLTATGLDRLTPELIGEMGARTDAQRSYLRTFLGALRANLADIEAYERAMAYADHKAFRAWIESITVWLDAEPAVRATLTEKDHERIEKAMKAAAPEAPPSEPRLPKPPRSPTAHYVHREIEETLLAQLRAGEQAGVRGVRGMAGVGKTELALWLAEKLNGAFPDGVVWVRLAERGAQAILQEMAGLLGLGLDPAAEVGAWATQIRATLPTRKALVVLDDVRDHHADAPEGREDSDLVAYLLPPAGCATLLTTRRTALPGLDAGALHDLDVFEEEEAVALVRNLIRAGAGEKGEAACRAEPEALRRLCIACGCNALALDVAAQLAAEQIAGLKEADVGDGGATPLGALADKLEDRAKKLRTLTLPEAGRSVEAALRVSYEALSETAQRRFDLLGVFAGDDFPEWAVAGVWALVVGAHRDAPPDHDPAQDIDDAASHLAVYRRRSMLVPAGEGRWALHDLWRAFAWAQLKETDLLGAARTAHDAVFAAYAGAYWEPKHVPLLHRERPDLAAAVAAAQGAGDPDLLYRLVGGASNMMYYCGYWREGETWLRGALEALETWEGDNPRRHRADLQDKLGDLVFRLGKIAEAEELYRGSMEIDEELNNPRGVAVSQGKLGDLAMRRGEPDEAERLYRAKLKTYEELGERRGVAVTQGQLGDLAMRRGEPDEAERLYTAHMETMTDLGERREVAVAQSKLGDLAMRRGEPDEAERLYRAAMATMEALGERRSVAALQGKLGDLAMRRGEPDEAKRLYRAAIDEMRRLGDKHQESVSCYNLAGHLHKQGRLEEAIALMERVVELEAAMNHPDLEEDRAILARWRAEHTSE